MKTVKNFKRGFMNIRVIAENTDNIGECERLRVCNFNRLALVMSLRYSGGAMGTEISRRLFTVHDYHRMVSAGILFEDDRVELIRGEILTMSPIGPPHNGAVLRASNGLFPIVGTRAIVGVQGSICLDDWDEPQPDIFLLRPRDDFYTTQHARPSDILLIIEIADSSLDYDRTVKVSLYAETGVPEYWVADIINDCVWAYSEARDKAYRSIREFHRGESIVPELLPDYRVPIDILLP
jgi:Uma2 family endonuclease